MRYHLSRMPEHILILVAYLIIYMLWEQYIWTVRLAYRWYVADGVDLISVAQQLTEQVFNMKTVLTRTIFFIKGAHVYIQTNASKQLHYKCSTITHINV